MSWHLLESETRSAQENMDTDRKILEECISTCCFHVYTWEKPSVTHGYFIKPESVLQIQGCKDAGIDIGKRITGGGVVFHLWDFAFSVLIPSSHRCFSENTLDNYALINNIVLSVVKPLLPENLVPMLTGQNAEAQTEACKHFCMARPTIYDVVVNEKKIAGAAQRRTKKGFLHQGTISILEPDVRLLEKILTPESQVLSAMRNSSYALLPKETDQTLFKEMQHHIKRELWNQLIKQIS